VGNQHTPAARTGAPHTYVCHTATLVTALRHLTATKSTFWAQRHCALCKRKATTCRSMRSEHASHEHGAPELGWHSALQQLAACHAGRRFTARHVSPPPRARCLPEPGKGARLVAQPVRIRRAEHGHGAVLARRTALGGEADQPRHGLRAPAAPAQGVFPRGASAARLSWPPTQAPGPRAPAVAFRTLRGGLAAA